MSPKLSNEISLVELVGLLGCFELDSREDMPLFLSFPPPKLSRDSDVMGDDNGELLGDEDAECIGFSRVGLSFCVPICTCLVGLFVAIGEDEELPPICVIELDLLSVVDTVLTLSTEDVFAVGDDDKPFSILASS